MSSSTARLPLRAVRLTNSTITTWCASSTWGCEPVTSKAGQKNRRGISPAPLCLYLSGRLLGGLLVWEDHAAGLQVSRGEHGLVVHALPGLEARALLDAMILHLQHACFGPFSLGPLPDGDFAHDT